MGPLREVDVGGAGSRGRPLLRTPLMQPLLGSRQVRHARRLGPGVLLVEVEDPPVHRSQEAVVTAGAVGRPSCPCPSRCTPCS